MDFKDYYATLGVEREADAAGIKRAYRKLARKYHPDVSKEPDAEARFKDVAEAYEALSDPERRAAYDDAGRRQTSGEPFSPSFDGGGFEFSGREAHGGGEADHSDFFEALFGRQAGRQAGRAAPQHAVGDDHHAKVQIDLRDSYRGGHRSISLRAPHTDAEGRVTVQERHLDVNIPKGLRSGQHLRLAKQGGPGHGEGANGDLYLEIEFAPDPRFRVDGRDVYIDVPTAPWEAALGANVVVATPDGSVELTVPPGSASGRKLRLKGKGLPGQPPGDLYAVLAIVLPPGATATAQAAYRAMASAFADFDPRHGGPT